MTLYRTYALAMLVPLLRTPAYWIPLVIFPSLLYLFFGVSPSQQSPQTANLLLASWSAFAVIGIGFFQFGISIAESRTSKWQDYARTLPAGALPRLMAQIVSAVFFLAISLTLLWTLSRLTTPVDLDLGGYTRLLATLLAGCIPFIMIGSALGYSVPPQGAVPIANLLYLPLSYLGGLWIPPQYLPDIVTQISPYTPTRQLGELAWAAALDTPVPMGSVQGLVMYAGVAGLIALIMWKRDETLKTG